jgi:hypothetical protein
MSGYINTTTLPPVSQNLTILFFIEIVVLVCALIAIITYKNIMSGSIKWYVIGICSLIIGLGFLIRDDPSNTESDRFMFLIDLIIIPAIPLIIVIVKILYEKFIVKSSITSMNTGKPSAAESTILATPQRTNGMVGGSKKRRRSSRRKGLAFY